MANKITKITLELECSKCGQPFTGDAEFRTDYFVCDCDMPCGCPNGPYAYIGLDCPHCQQENKAFILKNIPRD
jgi:hypothetical protein